MVVFVEMERCRVGGKEGGYMDARTLLGALAAAERLKDATRHCYTSGGRHESVAEHSWRAALMALLMKDELEKEFPKADMDKVIKMCVIHDLGEAFTGDIPTFVKTDDDRKAEDILLENWLETLPGRAAGEMKELFREMNERKTVEARIFKAIDGLEALIQHNESDISTWIPREYELNMTYCDDRVGFSAYLSSLREEIRQDTIKKIEEGKKQNA